MFNPEAIVAEDIRLSMRLIRQYAKPYRELLTRSEQGPRLDQILAGLTSGLERKSIEPIAVMHGIPRRGLQRFVGENGWRERPLLERQWKEVRKEVGADDAAVVIDGSGTPKKGIETVGVGRQWCGRLGKVDNCVIGVHAVYVGKEELATLVASELFLPRQWIDDDARRKGAYVPETTAFRSQAELGGGLVADLAQHLPFAWVLGDDEFGRARHFRDRVAELGKSYVLDVPSNSLVRRVTKWGRLGDTKWTLEKLARSRPVDDWTYFKVRDGEKGPIEVRALAQDVATARERGEWVKEKLLVIETTDGAQRWYCLARCDASVPLAELVRQAGRRHRIEEVFEEAKGEVGLDHFEVRAWHGWHHHMTLCQIAHWFLVREKRRLGKKSTRHHGQPDPHGHRSTPRPKADTPRSGGLRQLSPHAQLEREGVAIPRPGTTPAGSTGASPDGLTSGLQA
jgi:SRSO17 transposase